MQIIPEIRRAKFDVYVFYTPKVIDPLEYPYLHLPVSQFSANNLCFFVTKIFITKASPLAVYID